MDSGDSIIELIIISLGILFAIGALIYLNLWIKKKETERMDMEYTGQYTNDDIDNHVNGEELQMADISESTSINMPNCNSDNNDDASDCSSININNANRTSNTSDFVVSDSDIKVDVFLSNAGLNKIQAIKIIMQHTNMGLSMAKHTVDIVPTMVLKDVSEGEAMSFKQTLENIGCSVEIKYSKSS